MRTKTNVQAGGHNLNQSETLVRATAQSLKTGGDKNLENLKGLKGAEFDKAYVAHEVAYHQQVLDAMDQVLIPSAQNAELKALLVKVRPAFEAHLAHAKKIDASLAGKT